MLSDSLNGLISKRYKGKVVIITGTGNHSRTRVKVLPHVRQWLEQNGWKPKEATMSDGRGGMLLVQI
jgi:hypothetical protein